MHSLAELKRLNALHMDARNYPRLHSADPILHSLVRDSIISIGARVSLSEVQKVLQQGD